MLHVNIPMLHVNVNSLHFNIYTLQVDVINLKCLGYFLKVCLGFYVLLKNLSLIITGKGLQMLTYTLPRGPITFTSVADRLTVELYYPFLRLRYVTAGIRRPSECEANTLR